MSESTPPTEDVPVFNPAYFTTPSSFSQQSLDYLDANYLKFPISQATPEVFSNGLSTLNDIIFSSAVAQRRQLTNVENIIMTPLASGGAGYIQFPDGTQQTTAGGGGGGSVTNPMTSDLDGGTFNITNTTTLATTNLNNSYNNQTTAPIWYDWGAVSPQDYLVATATPIADTQGNIQFSVMCKDAGVRQSFTIQVIGFATRGVIRVINHQFEADTPIFTTCIFGSDGVNNVIALTCGTPSATCEIQFSDNFEDGGGSGTAVASFVPKATAGAVTLATTFASIPLNNSSAGTSGSWNVGNVLTALDTQTTTLSTTSVRNNTGNDIQFLNNIFMNSNDIKTANVISATRVNTDQLGDNGSGDVSLQSALDTNGQTIRNDAGDDILFADNIDLNGSDLKNVDEITPVAGGDVNVKGDIDMFNNAIINVDNIKTDSIFENTLGNGVVIHDQVSMTNKKITNCADPTLNQDVATKLYVDTTAGSSGVQNPMLSNLDCGGFNLNNCSGVTATTIQNIDGGNMFSKGTFQHGGIAIGDFGVGGDTITFQPSSTWSIKNFGGSTTYFEYDQSTQTFGAKTGSTIDVNTGAILQTSGGTINTEQGLFILGNSGTIVSTANELKYYDVGGGADQYLYFAGVRNSTPNIPRLVASTFQFRLFNQDATINAPLDTATGWNAGSNGAIIPLYAYDSLVYSAGLPSGVNNHDNNVFPYSGYLTGVGINNGSNLGGWVCTGIAEVELVYTNISVTNASFVPPVLIASAGNTFTSESVRLQPTQYARADFPAKQGIELSLRLNISGADTIDIQDIQNASINASSYLIAEIPMI
jgi:hypothetical protein